MCWIPVSNMGPRSSRQLLTTRPWPVRQKTDWHQPYCITHPAQQRADFGQERFSTGLLTSDTHYNDVIMRTMASQITSRTIVYSTVYPGADQRKHQSSASLAFVRGIHRGPVNSPHKGPITRKMFPFDDVIMSWCRTQAMVISYWQNEFKVLKWDLLFSARMSVLSHMWDKTPTPWHNAPQWEFGARYRLAKPRGKTPTRIGVLPQ